MQTETGAFYLTDTPMQNAANAAGISDQAIEHRAKSIWLKSGRSWERAWHMHRTVAREDAAKALLGARTSLAA